MMLMIPLNIMNMDVVSHDHDICSNTSVHVSL